MGSVLWESIQLRRNKQPCVSEVVAPNTSARNGFRCVTNIVVRNEAYVSEWMVLAELHCVSDAVVPY
jgi:hypothetical protein